MNACSVCHHTTTSRFNCLSNGIRLDPFSSDKNCTQNSARVGGGSRGSRGGAGFGSLGGVLGQ